MKKKVIGVLLIATLLFSTMSVMAASGSDVTYGTISGETCSGNLSYGNSSGTAKSTCSTISLYSKRATISIEYYRGSAGPYYAGDSSTVYNTASAVYATKSLASGNTSSSASGSHYFENSNGYVTILDTYA